MKKALWVTSLGGGSIDRLLDHAQEAGASLLCIRTTSSALPKAIDKLGAHDIEVYGWRWPAVVPGPHSAPHYFATDEAQYVVDTLIPAGLAGYIADPESDGAGEVDDWNESRHAALAKSFCDRIPEGANAAKRPFHFGTTSGCEYPVNHRKIPWKEFVAASDALYPQTYWRNSRHQSLHGGSPLSSYSKGISAWEQIATGKPLVAIAGELETLLPEEIREFGKIVRDKQEVAHFFVDSSDTFPKALKAIASL